MWGGVVFSVNSDNYCLKASSQHSVIFPDLSWTRSLALISSQISRILKQVHWEYLWAVSAELLPQSIFQPRCLGKAVGHLFPDCYFWWWPTWPSGEAGWKTQLWHHRKRCLKLENYYSSDFIFITFHLPLNAIYFHKINLPPGLTCILKYLCSWNRQLNSSNVWVLFHFPHKAGKLTRIRGWRIWLVWWDVLYCCLHNYLCQIKEQNTSWQNALLTQFCTTTQLGDYLLILLISMTLSNPDGCEKSETQMRPKSWSPAFPAAAWIL